MPTDSGCLRICLTYDSRVFDIGYQGGLGSNATPHPCDSNDKAAISGGLVTAEQEGLKSARLSPRKVRSRSSSRIPRYTPTAIGAARIPPHEFELR
jgi:hypothetical protein